MLCSNGLPKYCVYESWDHPREFTTVVLVIQLLWAGTHLGRRPEAMAELSDLSRTYRLCKCSNCRTNNTLPNPILDHEIAVYILQNVNKWRIAVKAAQEIFRRSQLVKQTAELLLWSNRGTYNAFVGGHIANRSVDIKFAGSYHRSW